MMQITSRALNTMDTNNDNIIYYTCFHECRDICSYMQLKNFKLSKKVGGGTS